ncbi:MAG: cytochrome c oxidase subunit II [Acidobacteriota bacterium]
MSSLRDLLDCFSLHFSAQADGSFWMPPVGSTGAPEVDRVFYFVFWISLFFFLLIAALMVFFLVRFRRRPGYAPGKAPHQHMALEITWSVIPLIIVGAIFYMGFRGFMNLSTPPANAYEIQVAGQKWKWLFTYPNGYVDENLHVPVDEPIRLVMTSEDVIHSLFVPSFRIKKDVVPGRYTKAWFQAIQPGEYQILCAEYCGKGHSDMSAAVIVHEPGGFEKWLENASNFLATMPPSEAGERLYRSRGCAQCHSADGRPGTGPSFKGVFGKTQLMKDGSSVLADENYIRESILEPEARVVAGYDPVMPTFKGRIKDQEITAIIEYLKTLREQ